MPLRTLPLLFLLASVVGCTEPASRDVGGCDDGSCDSEQSCSSVLDCDLDSLCSAEGTCVSVYHNRFKFTIEHLSVSEEEVLLSNDGEPIDTEKWDGIKLNFVPKWYLADPFIRVYWDGRKILETEPTENSTLAIETMGAAWTEFVEPKTSLVIEVIDKDEKYDDEMMTCTFNPLVAAYLQYDGFECETLQGKLVVQTELIPHAD